MTTIQQDANNARAASDQHHRECPVCSRPDTFAGMCGIGRELSIQASILQAEAAEEKRRGGRIQKVVICPKPAAPEYHI